MTPLEVSPRDYHAKLGLDRSNVFSPHSWLSKSRLWELRSCSLWKWRYAPRTFTPTSAMTWGSLIDCYITTPEEVASTVVFNPYPDFRTKAAQTLRDEAVAAGKIVVSQEMMAQITDALDRLRNDEIAGPVIENSKTQMVLLGKLKGIQFKSLVDFAPENEACLYDLKTTNDFSLRGFAKTIDSFGYHVQAALYLKMWNLVNPSDQRDRFRFIWQDSNPPYEVAVTELPAFDIAAGEEWAANQLDRIIAATNSGIWPGITGGKVAMVGRPGYAAFQDEEDADGVNVAPTIGGKGGA
jgi:hypothetical protein